VAEMVVLMSCTLLMKNAARVLQNGPYTDTVMANEQNEDLAGRRWTDSVKTGRRTDGRGMHTDDARQSRV